MLDLCSTKKNFCRDKMAGRHGNKGVISRILRGRYALSTMGTYRLFLIP